MCFNYLVIEAQIPVQEDLENKESIQFPAVTAVTNTSTNDPLLFDSMTPMIEIPTSIVLRQLEEGTYILLMHISVCILLLSFIAMHYNVILYICVLYLLYNAEGIQFVKNSSFKTLHCRKIYRDF